MVKPKYGYSHATLGDLCEIPADLPETLFQELKVRRTFFEVTLHDWIVKHDLIGDGTILKTISKRGEGFNRPQMYDELKFTLEIKQNGEILIPLQEINLKFEIDENPAVTPVILRILQSMKETEITSSVVQWEYLKRTDGE